MRDPSFSFYDFRKWLDSHPEKLKLSKKVSENDKGLRIESRIGIRRLIFQIEKDNPTIESVDELAYEFKVNGGIIKDIKDDYFLIITESAEFYLPKVYVKKSS